MAPQEYKPKKAPATILAVQYLPSLTTSVDDIQALCHPLPVAHNLADDSLLAPFRPQRPQLSIKVKPMEWLVKSGKQFKSLTTTQFNQLFEPVTP